MKLAEPVNQTSIRRFQDKDAAPAAHLFHEAVHKSTKGYYDQNQRNAWSPVVPDTDRWRELLATQISFVAERNGRFAGFMSMNRRGHLGLAYTSPGLVRTGIATRLYAALEVEARTRSLKCLSTEASHLARPFFQRHGWHVIREQTVERHGVNMQNFVMQKHLT